MDAQWKQRFRRSLLRWFARNARDLPWRQTRDPYRIWVSEVMLQQTQVATVIDYYQRFVQRFPDVSSLAAADEQEVLRLWEGLGYYRRARQLHAAARKIVAKHGGEFPADFDDVQALPGIGRYTAGAILSIAHDARLPILEANTIRLFSRLIAYRDEVTRAEGQKLLWQVAEDLLPRKNAGDFNQALMELGSEICRPTEPLCDDCPVRVLCPTRAHGWQSEIPAAKKKTNYEDVRQAAVVVRRNGKVVLRRCAEGERWAGLWDFPRFDLDAVRGEKLVRELKEKVSLQTGLAIEPGEHLATLKHGVTRFRITLHCYESKPVSGRLPRGADGICWVQLDDLDDYPLSVTGRKIVNLLDRKGGTSPD